MIAQNVIPSEADANVSASGESSSLLWIYFNVEWQETFVRFLHSLVATWSRLVRSE
ncbi:MAG: hypothetical protein M1378_08130 [Bacteroidetes bacterium]|nr:hypothetical protein [Bacteroidota bacterium]